jgi:hypothetical protein
MYKLRCPAADEAKLRKDGKPYSNGAKEKAYVLCVYQDCLSRECFHLFRNKGPFVPGRGYTSYYKKPQFICGRNHLHGCPDETGDKEETK